MAEQICDMNCLECIYDDCINESEEVLNFERKFSTYLDNQVLVSRGMSYTPTSHKRQIKEVDEKLYKQAQRRYFHKKYYEQDPEKYRRLGRENYAKHKEARLENSHKYYLEHKEEISASKRAYYLEHREQILADRKSKYVPHPKQVINTPQAELKRQRERERYLAHKEEINAKRRQKRKERNNSDTNNNK